MANNIDLTICALECPLGTFQCSGRLIFRLRTEPAFQAAPVFRMAYSAPTAHRAVSSETLMLQVRFAHPPNPAPSYRFFVLFSKKHDLQVRFAHPPNCAPKPSFRRFRCSAWLILRFRTIAHTGAGVSLGLFGKPKRSSFSRIRGLHRSTLCFFFQNAHASGSLRSPSELRTVLSFLLH